MDYLFPGDIGRGPDGSYIVTFPDVPEAITEGDSFDEAKRNAEEALGLALRGYLAMGKPLPRPSTRRGKHVAIAVSASDAMKLAVIEAFQASGISKSEFARRLGKAETEAHRILNPDHPTKPASLDMALRALGKQIVVSVMDAAA